MRSVEAVRLAQEAADVQEARRLLKRGANERLLLMAIGLEDEADTRAAKDFLARVHNAATKGDKSVRQMQEQRRRLLNSEEQRELQELQRLLALSTSDYCMEQERFWARRLQEHGGVLIHTPGIPSSLLSQLGEWCETRAAWLREVEPGHKSRAGRNEASNLRFSLNHARNMEVAVWQRVEKEILEAGLQPFLKKTFGCNYSIIGAGGDVVYPGASKGQDMHSDGLMTRPSTWPAVPRWLVLSIAVHDITERDAPMIFIGKKETRSFVTEQPPTQEYERSHWQNMKVLMKRGDIFLRDPLVWHRGSALTGEIVRYLPGLVLQRSWD